MCAQKHARMKTATENLYKIYSDLIYKPILWIELLNGLVKFQFEGKLLNKGYHHGNMFVKMILYSFDFI